MAASSENFYDYLARTRGFLLDAIGSCLFPEQAFKAFLCCRKSKWGQRLVRASEKLELSRAIQSWPAERNFFNLVVTSPLCCYPLPITSIQQYHRVHDDAWLHWNLYSQWGLGCHCRQHVLRELSRSESDVESPGISPRRESLMEMDTNDYVGAPWQDHVGSLPAAVTVELLQCVWLLCRTDAPPAMRIPACVSEEHGAADVKCAFFQEELRCRSGDAAARIHRTFVADLRVLYILFLDEQEPLPDTCWQNGPRNSAETKRKEASTFWKRAWRLDSWPESYEVAKRLLERGQPEVPHNSILHATCRGARVQHLNQCVLPPTRKLGGRGRWEVDLATALRGGGALVKIPFTPTHSPRAFSSAPGGGVLEVELRSDGLRARTLP